MYDVDMPLMEILLTPLAMILVGYALFAAILALAVHPLRVRLVTLCEEFLAEKRWNDVERAELNGLIDTAMSFKAGAMMIPAGLAAILDKALGKEPPCIEEHARLDRDPRFDKVIAFYVLSVLAANPFAAVIAIPILIVAVAMDLLLGQGGSTNLVEDTALRAMGSIPPVQKAA